MPPRTRFAPSPTGYLHVGGLRTAAYAYALAKKDLGQFLLRIEDTDQKREVSGATEKIYEILRKFNLNWDEGPLVGGPHEPYVQSERVASGIYKNAAEKLITQGNAYYCFCPPKSKEEIKDLHEHKRVELRDACRSLTPEEVGKRLDQGLTPAIRLKVPENEVITFYDFVIKKETTWKSADVDDAMLLKSDGFPTYHLAMPVDDTDMKITHVIRSAEWFSSSPIHVLVFKYLKLPLPQIGHPSAILDPEGGKLSKRKGNVSVEEFLSEGYLPEALLNFVILLGWAPKDNRELYTLEEFVQGFDINGFQKSNPVFNTQKLDWFNGYYIRLKTDDELLNLIKPFLKEPRSDETLLKIIPLIKDRLVKLTDFDSLTSFFFTRPSYDQSLWPNLESSQDHIAFTIEKLSNTNWTKEEIENSLVPDVKAKGWKLGDFFMTLRLAICGSKFTPPLTETMLILGKEESLHRLNLVQQSL